MYHHHHHLPLLQQLQQQLVLQAVQERAHPLRSLRLAARQRLAVPALLRAEEEVLLWTSAYTY